MRLRMIALAAGLALASSACSGPQASLEIGAREVPVDVLLGRSPPPRPPFESPGPIGFPGFIQPPLPRVQPGVLPPPRPEETCPRANPLDAVLLPAFLRAPVPPVEATYPFRNEGSFQIGDAARTPYPPLTDRTVSNVQTLSDGNFEFDVSTRIAGETTITTYRVLNAGVTRDRGVYIRRIVTERADDTEAFVPHQPILLLPFPGEEIGTGADDEVEDLIGREYRSVGIDPITRTAMTLEARIADTKTRVDACGRWVDGFEVEVIEGRIIAPLKDVTFEGRYVVATQYGGLIVEDDIEMSGTDTFQTLESRNRARINVLPADPAAA